MAIQVRRGNEADFDPSKMLPGEWAVSLDTRYVRMCFSPGVCLRMATYEAFEADTQKFMQQIENILSEVETVQEAVKIIQNEIESSVVAVENYVNSARYYSELSNSYAMISKGYSGEASGYANDAFNEAERAKTYAEEVKAVVNIDVATKETIGLIKGGENYIADDGTLTLTRNTTESNLFESNAGGLEINEIVGKSIQNGIPTPSNPIEIESVFLKQITVKGAQLFDISKYSAGVGISNSSGAEYTDANMFSTDYIDVTGLTDLAWSGMASESATWGAFYDADKKYIGSLLTISYITTITIPDGAYYARISFLNKYLDTLMINAGTELLPWQRYTEKTITLSEPITLHGIEDVKDRIVKKDGVWGVERNVGVIALSGTESWVGSGTAFDNCVALNLSVSNKLSGWQQLKSNRFSYMTQADYNNADINGIGGYSNIITVKVLRAVLGGFSGTNTQAVTVWKEFLAGLYADGNPIVIHYPLAKATFELLPVADQIALNSLVTYDSVTYIGTDSDVESVIEVEYGTSKVGANLFKVQNELNDIKANSNIKLYSNIKQLLGYNIKNSEVTLAMLVASMPVHSLLRCALGIEYSNFGLPEAMQGGLYVMEIMATDSFTTVHLTDMDTGDFYINAAGKWYKMSGTEI